MNLVICIPTSQIQTINTKSYKAESTLGPGVPSETQLISRPKLLYPAQTQLNIPRQSAALLLFTLGRLNNRLNHVGHIKRYLCS